MKNFFFVSLLVVFLFSASQAQITLEATYPSNSGFTGHISVVKFGFLGEKYVLFEGQDSIIQIFGLNNVLEKTITIPAAVINQLYSVLYVSDNLFDLDSSIEYFVVAPMTTIPAANCYVVKEDGSVLLTIDSSSTTSADPNQLSSFSGIYPTASGTKLLWRKYNYGYLLYSLPGSLPCHECNEGVFSGNFSPSDQNMNSSTLSNPYPNPTSNLTRIDYQLPHGIKQGELVLYNTQGIEVKRFKVTGTFDFIYVSAHDLPTGTYYYNLETSAGMSGEENGGDQISSHATSILKEVF